MPDHSKTSNLAIYLRLLRYLKPLAIPFTISLLGFALYASSQPMLAKAMELIIDAIEQKNADARHYLPLFAVGVYIYRGIGFFLGTYYNEYVGITVVHHLRQQIFNHLLLLPARFYNDTTQGQLLHRISSGVTQVQSAVTTALKTLIREGLTIIALLGYIFYLNWQLSLVFLVAFPILGLIVTKTARRFRKITRRSEKELGDVMQVSKESIGNFMVVRGFGAEDYESARYQTSLNKAYKSQLKIRKIQAFYAPLSQTIVSIAVGAIVFLLLDPSVLAKNSTGELVGYLTAVALIPKSLRMLSGVGITLQRGIVGAELIFNILDEDKERDTGTHTTERAEGAITIRDLTFRYPNTDADVLKQINLDIKPGEMVALVGKSGSGKSTLSTLLYRLFDVENGCIQIDGIDINNYQLANLRQQIAVVNQNIALFDDTIRNNIGYGNRCYSDAEITEALRKAHALDFINALPAGLDTVVGENGLKLSGGQRQRLAIARAFLKDAPILILDEATSALDNESEAAITQGVEELAQSRTTLVIAHRLSTILHANKLIVMEAGQIVETGTHQQLLANGKHYKNLYATELSAD